MSVDSSWTKSTKKLCTEFYRDHTNHEEIQNSYTLLQNSEFAEEDVHVKLTASSFEAIRDKLHQLILMEKASNEEVIHWIEV